MNSDLAYCLERFIDDQIQLIDDYLETVKEKKTIEHQRIEQMKMLAIEKRKQQTDGGPEHVKDAAIVQRFINKLLDIADNDNTPDAKELRKYREMMYSEFTAKIDDCSNHVIRLRNLAKPTFRSDDFVKQCNKTIKYLQQEQTLTENYDKLYEIIDQSDQANVADNVQNWWDEAYGSVVTKIIHLNKRFNPGVGNIDIALVQPWSQPIDCARKILLIETPKTLANYQKKYNIVCEFVRQIQSIDDENRQEISENNLINKLNRGDIDFAKNYTENWLIKRDQSRNQKEDASCEYYGIFFFFP
jgi:hypothetical protein